MKSRKVDIYMTYSYENGNKENPKYVYETHGGREDLLMLTERLCQNGGLENGKRKYGSS